MVAFSVAFAPAPIVLPALETETLLLPLAVLLLVLVGAVLFLLLAVLFTVSLAVDALVGAALLAGAAAATVLLVAAADAAETLAADVFRATVVESFFGFAVVVDVLGAPVVLLLPFFSSSSRASISSLMCSASASGSLSVRSCS